MAGICLETGLQMKHQKEEIVARNSFVELEKGSKPKYVLFVREKKFQNKTKCDLHKNIVHWPTLVSFNVRQKNSQMSWL